MSKMPKTSASKETSNHPCHFLSLPQAKRFWCRHCMSVFEDAITRWRHSRSCRYGVVNNFIRRRQLEAKALQNSTKPNPIEARLEHSISPSEEPIVSEEGGDLGSTSGEKSNQATSSNDLFRCFICHNRFSTLEEMRHHVKYPCNNKKIITDVPNPAMTVYIDEFTDRSRQWDPQPQQEEVISSELIPNIVSQEMVQTADVKTETTRDNVTLLSENKQRLTPTNIYVNEQGETVIEVENLDLNSEGGELSLAHLLTQLSQQGIVFDKNKASQMQAQHEATVSDSASGEIYASGTSFDASPTTHTVLKEDDEGQPTAEDAANTLAQLAVFRGGYRTNPETYDGTHGLRREYVMEGTNESYTYSENYAIPSTTSSDHQLTISNSGGHANFNVEYNYNYLSSNQPVIVSTTPHLPLQSGILDSGTSHFNSVGVGKDFNNIHSVPTLQLQNPDSGQPQVVTYISSSAAQQTQTPDMQEETMLIEDYVVEDSSSSVPSEQYVNIPDGLRQSESQQAAAIPALLDTNHHNSYIVFSSDDNSTQIICNPQDHNQNNLNVNPNCVPESVINNINNAGIPNNHQHQHHFVSSLNDTSEGTSMSEETKDSGEFEVQTVTLQEIAEEETTGAVSFSETPSGLCSQPSGNLEINVTNSCNNSELQQASINQSNDQCIQLGMFRQTTASNDIIHNPDESFTVDVEQQPSQDDGSFTIAVEQHEQQLSHEDGSFTVTLEQHHQQLSHDVSVPESPSSSSPMPVYVISPHGSLQLLATSQEGALTQSAEFQVPTSNNSPG